MKNILFSILIIGIFISGCEDNNSSNDKESQQSNIIEVLTHDIDELNASGFYYNLVSDEEVDSSALWHLSFQIVPVSFNGSYYDMPNLILGEGVYVAEYSNVTFDSIKSSPESFMSDYFQDASVVEYGGTNVVLDYSFQPHGVIVSESVFVFYEPISHNSYKVQFLDYISGSILFQYSSLD